jgi:hypothetical protein
VQYSLGRRKKAYAHRLVAAAFITQQDARQCTVNHKDANKRNNYVGNLEWATHKEQNTHARHMNLIPDLSRFDNTLKLCLQTLCDKYSQKRLSDLFGMSQQTISDWGRGKYVRREKSSKNPPAGD